MDNAQEPGWTRWIPVLGGFLCFVYSWGPILAFGAYQQYYQDTILSSYTESSIAWIGTASGFLLFFVGILTGPVFDAGYLRWLLVGGSFCIAFGTMMNSLASEYYQIFLTQSILIGVGSGMLWVPCNSFIATRFPARERALAVGITTSGSSIGGVVFPIMFRLLQSGVGFGWAVRYCGFLVLGIAILALAILLPYQSPKSPFVRHFVDTSAFSDVPFLLLAASGFFSMMGYYMTLVYLPTFTATHIRDHVPDGLPFYILALTNGVSSFARISAGLIAMRAGPLQTYIVALLSCAILALIWISVQTTAGVIVWTVFWGMASGLIASLPAAIIPLFTPQPTLIGTRMGLIMVPCSLGLLVGGPIGGVIIGKPSPLTEWWPLQVLVGLSMLVATCLCIYPAISLMNARKQERLAFERDTAPTSQVSAEDGGSQKTK